MGQTTSSLDKNQYHAIKKSSSCTSTNSFKAKKHLTRIELVSLQYIFQELKSTFPDGLTCIEPKKFLEHLNLPSQVEPAGVLLFKSFSYLGSYPSTAGPVPLSFDAFITAFVILTGKLNDLSLENLFFQSLSVLPAPTTEEEEVVESPIIEPSGSSKGLSLAELGVDFNELDFDTNTNTKEDTDDDDDSLSGGSEILCRDLIELFVLLLWLGEADKQTTHDFKHTREMAKSIVTNMKSLSAINTNRQDILPCISHHLFFQWKNKFSPHLFKPIESFVMKSFGFSTPLLDQEIILQKDKVPIPDKSDILIPIYSTLLSWTLPENILITKQWTRLYSADKDGFSMNRFESHVFKYPGPTLFLIQVDAVVSSHSMLARTPPKERTWSTTSLDIKKPRHQSMILGAYITQPWKHSKQFWGTNECFLFELDPSFDIFRPVFNRKGESNNTHYIYYHHDFGIGFGATTNHLTHHTDQRHGFILSLQNTLQQGIYENEAYPSQPTFISATNHKKHSDFFYKFDTENIEVFGLGNEKDRERQAKEWKFEKKEADKRSGLNIRRSDGQLDKELLKMAGIIDEDKRQDR